MFFFWSNSRAEETRRNHLVCGRIGDIEPGAASSSLSSRGKNRYGIDRKSDQDESKEL